MVFMDAKLDRVKGKRLKSKGLILVMKRDASSGMASARPCRDNTPLATDKETCAPKFVEFLLLVLGNQAKQAVLFVRNSSGEVSATPQRKRSHKPSNWSGVPSACISVSMKAPVVGS
jgi:hypothetical protein